jgi:two-component system sensor histidine kinase UhpB
VKNQSGEVYRVAGIAEDITERKHAENALRDSGVQLQALTRRLVELQESERKDLARELHDRVGQSLTVLNINLAILRDGLLQHDIGMMSRLQDSVTLVESTSQTIQNVASDLRPPMLDDYGLQPALHWYAEQFSARTGVAIWVRAGAPDERVAADVEIALFRIVQEALNNVAKHARAKSVVIALECQGSEYVMSVVDDGMGFRAADERADRPRPKLGMVTMRERAQAVGGRLLIEPRPGGGTRLTVRVPK